MEKHSLTLLLLVAGGCLQAQNPFTTEKLIKAERDRQQNLQAYDVHSVASNNFDVTFYRCEWTVDPGLRFIAGAITSYFKIVSATTNIVFDLSTALTVDSVQYHGSKIDFAQTSNNALQINFPSLLNQNQKDSLSIFYKGIPRVGSYFVSSTHNGTPIIWTLSEPYGASTWWPCKDVLKDKADSIDIIVTNPSSYRSSSNGLAVSESIVGGNRVTHWKHRYPIASYLVAIAVTNYDITSDTVRLSRQMPVITYTYPEVGTAFQSAINTAKFCLENFSLLISEYPFVLEKYGQTQFDYGGGMEHQTNSFITSPAQNLVAHELAHQWFGDKVTCGSWSDIWLNEGFATYMEYVFTEQSNPAEKLPRLQSWTNNVTSAPGGSVFVIDTLNFGRMFDGRLSYRKGAYLLHMLRGLLGDSVFFRALRRYLSDPLLKYNTARTSDLQRNLEAESGKDLAEFLRDWFYGQGYPNYHAEWGQLPNNIVRLRLFQTSSDPSVPFFEMRVRLKFMNPTRDTILTVDHRSNGQPFTLDPGFAADTVIIDPELWILSRTKTTSKISITAPDKMIVYPNPSFQQLNIAMLAQIQNTVVRIFNSAGQQVYASKLTPGTLDLSIKVSNWATGIYFVRVNGTDFRETKRILIKRR